MTLDLATIQIMISVITATAVIVWRVAKATNDLKELIHNIDKKVSIIETKTVNVSLDHDKLVLVEREATAAHRRLDEYTGRTINE